METKKNGEVNNERLRFPIGLTALLFTGSVVLASFTYTSGLERENQLSSMQSSSNIQFLEEATPKVEPPKEEPQMEIILPPTDKILIDSNQQKQVKSVVVVPDPPKIKIGNNLTTPVKEDVIEWPDKEAFFDGGAAAMQRWISENVVYPQTSIEINEQGKVYLSFVVEKDGSISNIAIERGVSPDLDREAKRLLRAMPKWIPGESKGQKARTRCRLPINFTLN